MLSDLPKFGLLQVLGPADKTLRGVTYWFCLCDCGMHKWVHAGNIKRGATVSCGCYVKAIHRKHNHTTLSGKSPTYSTWDNMVQRCTNMNAVAWPYYGGRGISVDPDWFVFGNFLADMGLRPEGMSLDRVNPDGNYCKDNCRWASKAEQSQNTKRTKLNPELVREIRSSSLSAAAFARIIGCSKDTVLYVRRGKTWRNVI